MQQMLGVSVDPVRHQTAALHMLCQCAVAIQMSKRSTEPTLLVGLLREPGAPPPFRVQAGAMLRDHLRWLMAQRRGEEAEQLARELHRLWQKEAGIEGFMARSFYLQGDLLRAGIWFGQVKDWSKEPAAYALAHFFFLVETRSLEWAQKVIRRPEQNFSTKNQDDALSSLLLDTFLTGSETDELRKNVDSLCRAFPQPASPRVLGLTSPFVGRLLQRLEQPTPSDWEVYAADVLATAMYAEHGYAPYHGNACITLARWLLMTGKRQEAWMVTEREAEMDPAFTSGFAYLSLFGWICGYRDLAQDALDRLDVITPAQPAQQFARWIACAVNGDLKRASACMEQLFQQSPDYFINQPPPTVWCMLSLALQAMGQQALALRAGKLGEKTDPLNHCRAHLLARVKVPISEHPISPFTWPEVL